MKNLTELLTGFKELLLPKVEINEQDKVVRISGGIFGTTLTETYFMLRGYSLETAYKNK